MATAAKTNVTNVQVPGDTTTPVTDETTNSTATVDASATSAQIIETNKDDQTAALQAQIDALQAQNAALQSSNDELTASNTDLQTQVVKAQQSAKKTVAAVIPSVDPKDYSKLHASNVDSSTLKSPVLTLDGWVLPAKKGN